MNAQGAAAAAAPGMDVQVLDLSEALRVGAGGWGVDARGRPCALSAAGLDWDELLAAVLAPAGEPAAPLFMHLPSARTLLGLGCMLLWLAGAGSRVAIPPHAVPAPQAPPTPSWVPPTPIWAPPTPSWATWQP